MNTSDRSKRNVVSGRRRWIFSKKKMKDTEKLGDDGIPQVFDLKRLLELRHMQLKPRANLLKSSKLIPKIQDILKKSVALGYFLDFLKDHDKKHLLEFWLEAETFRTVSVSSASSSGSNSLMSCSTRSSPCMQRYKQMRQHNRSASISSESSNLVKSRNSFSKICDGTLVENGNIDTNNTSLGEFSNDESLFSSSLQELNVSSENTMHTCGQSACLCTDITNPKLNTETRGDAIKDNDVGNSDKADQINSMHRSNHEWISGTNEYPSVNQTNDKLDNDDSLEKGLENVFLQKSRSDTVSSMEELRQRSRGRSRIFYAMTIYSKYICGTGDFPIDLPTQVRHRIEGDIGNKDRNNLDPNIFNCAQDYVFVELSSLYEKFLNTAYMINYQIKLLEEKDISFIDVLYCENILFYFTEFLDQSGCKSVLEFYITAQNFEEDIEAKLLNGEYNVENAVNDAMYIYEKYFSMKHDQQLIEDDKLRIVLENNICRADGPQHNCFCIPLAYAWTVMNDIYMPLFLKSDIYLSYIEHLKKVLCSPSVKAECTSTHNTMSLEHSPTYEFKTCQLNLLEDNLEDFWFKGPTESSSGGLKLGHVNEFGIFNSEMEPEPPKDKSGESSVSKFGKAMKNFLRGENPEESEQLAWRRAEKIIAEIQKETGSNI